MMYDEIVTFSKNREICMHSRNLVLTLINMYLLIQSGFDGFQEERRVRKELPSRYRNRLSKLNKSSSLHDLAHGFATDGNRVSKRIQ